MSKEVDERVVEMRFDNKQFEQNVQTSMSTLDKLKKSLKFDGAEKGLEKINAASKNCNMSSLSNSISTVQAKFSALEVVAITTLANITNSVVNAGKNMLHSLTVEPISDGFSEYELEMNSVQTIMASTGASIDEVMGYLDELNTYADKTIYSFSDMTANIGKFTNAGVSLKDATMAIQGISNEAAVSGANTNEASRAMYNFAQALSAGYVKLIDWKSIENANMATVEFKTQLLESAVAAGTLEKTADGMYKVLSINGSGSSMDATIDATHNFNESLEYQWMTTDALVGTLKDYADETTEIGKKAYAAAQDVKTFSQLIDTIKESVGSGWAKTWEIIFGNFEEAKSLWGEVYTAVDGIVSAVSEARNSLLEGALSSKWSQLSEKIEDTGISVSDFQEKLKETAKSHGIALDELIEKEGSLSAVFAKGKISGSLVVETLKKFTSTSTTAAKATSKVTEKVENFDKVVSKVINGDFGSGEERAKKLTKAGYDYATIQNLVNEKLGSSVKHVSELTEEQLKNADATTDLSDAELENLGYTEEQIKAIRELAEEAEKSGTPINELISSLEKPSGRELLIDTFRNALTGLSRSIKAVREAWTEIFPPVTSNQLYNIIAGLHSFSERLVISEENADKLRRSVKGLFAIVDIIATFVGGAMKVALKLLCKLLGMADINVLDLTASVGDAIVTFHDWLFENNQVVKVLKKLGSAVTVVLDKFKEWFNTFRNLPIVQTNLTRFENAFSGTFTDLQNYFAGGVMCISDFIDRVKAMDSITLDDIGDIFKDFRDNVLGYFLDIDGCFEKIGGAVTKLGSDIQQQFGAAGKSTDSLLGKIVSFATTVKDKLSDSIGVGEILTVGMGVGLIVFVKKLSKTIDKLTKPLFDLSAIIGNFNKVLGSCSQAINAFALKTKSEALRNVAVSIAILAGSLYLLTKADQDNLKSAAITLGILAGGLLALTSVMGKLNKIGSGVNGSFSFVGISVALLLLVQTLKSMESLNSKVIIRDLVVLAALAGGLALVAGLLGKFAPQLSKGSLSLISISVALKIMVSALSDLDKLEFEHLGRSIEILLGAMTGLIAVSVVCKNIKLRSALSVLIIVAALKLFVGALDDIADMDTKKIKDNLANFVVIFGSLAAVMIATNFAGQYATKAALAILAVSAALILIVAAMKMMSSMEPSELKRATKSISQLMIVFAGVIALSNLAGANAAKAGAMLLLMSGAILILSGCIVILSHVEPSGLKRALGAITTLELVFGALIAITKYAKDAKDVKGTLVLLAVTIGILAASLGALSMINPKNLTAATVALSSVIGMFALLIASTNFAKKATGTLVIMTGVVTSLAGILYLLAGLPTGSALSAAEGLSILLLSLSASIAIIGVAGTVFPTALITVGIMTLIVAALAAILGVLAKMDVDSTLEIAKSLSLLLLSLSASCLVLAAVGATGPAAFVGIGALVTLIASVGTLMAAIGALVTYFPDLELFLSKGISILNQIGEGLGSFFGNIVGGFVSGVSGQFPQIGTDLSAFMTNAQPFIDGASKIPESMISGVAALAESILILTATDLIEGMVSWLTGGSSLAGFGDQLVPFGEAMGDFAKSVKGLDVDDVKNAAKAGKAVAEMANAIPNSGGFVGLLVGNNDLGDFADQLKPFGEAIVEFADVVGSLDDGAIEAVKRAAEAGKAIAEMADSIPNEGGALGFFLGNNDMDVFGTELTGFGYSLVQFANTVGNLNEDSIKAIENAAKAGTAVAEMADSIPKEDGLISLFTGENGMGLFGMQLVLFGKAIKNFATTVDGLKADVITNAVTAGKATTSLAESVPSVGGLVTLVTGWKGLGTFGAQLVLFGQAMVNFANTVNGLKTSAVANATTAGKAAAELANSLPEKVGLFSKKESLSSFGENLDSFGDYIASYYNSVQNVNPSVLSGVVTQVERLVDMANNISSIDIGGMTSFGSALKTMALNGIDDFIQAFGNSEETVKNTISDFEKQATDAIDSTYPDFKESGKYLVEGFAKGISENTYKAKAQAMLMAQAATNAANTTLGVHSPSKVFIKIGGYVAEGFANGISAGKNKAKKSSTELAKVGIEAAKAVQKSLKSSNSVFADFVEDTDDNGNAVKITLKKAAEAFSSFRDSVKESLEDTSNLFEEFENDTETSGKEMLANLESQIEGIATWASNIQLLSQRGLNKNLLKVLSDMGTSGAKYVSALVTMSDKQLKKLNKLYKERMSLNDTAASEIAASFLDGGTKAGKAYAKGLTEAASSASSSTKSATSKLSKETMQNLSNLKTQLEDIIGWTYKDAIKEMKSSLDYGGGAFQQFCNAYLTSTKNITLGTKAIKAASTAITAYGEKLYEESDYYEEDNANITEHRKELKALQKDRKSLQKQLKKAQKSNTKASKEQVKTLKEQIKANKSSIAAAKEQIKNDEDEIAEHTKTVYNELCSSLSSSISSFLDPLQVSLDTGIDLFSKYESNEDLYAEDKKNLEEYQSQLEELETKQASIQSEINSYSDQNTLAARKRVKELEEQLDEVEDSIEEAKNNIEQAESDMASHSEVTTSSILENMKSQVDGISKWQSNLTALANKGLSQGLLDQLKDMGINGADYVSAFLNMTEDEIAKANEYFAQSESQTSQTLLTNFKDTLSEAESWAADLQKLAEMGFSQDLLEKLGDMGVDGYDYVKAFLSMTPEQVSEFNEEFANSLKLPDTLTNQVISSYAYAGAQSVEGFTAALTALAEEGTDENAALTATATEIGKVIAKALKKETKSAGKKAAKALANGLSENKESAKTSSSTLGKATLNALKGVLTQTAGKSVANNIISGLKSGLIDGKSSVSKIAKQVAKAALSAAKSTLGINSPSKEFAALGKYSDEGFAQGLLSGENEVYNTASGIMSKTIADLSSAIDSSVDTQPTIRPVMDLTEVQNGAATIGGLINGQSLSSSIHLASSISSGMSRNLTGSDQSVLNAIGKLQNTLSGILERPNVEQHNSFTITGDDPKAIANEVSHILQQQVNRRTTAWA